VIARPAQSSRCLASALRTAALAKPVCRSTPALKRHSGKSEPAPVQSRCAHQRSAAVDATPPLLCCPCQSDVQVDPSGQRLGSGQRAGSPDSLRCDRLLAGPAQAATDSCRCAYSRTQPARSVLASSPPATEAQVCPLRQPQNGTTLMQLGPLGHRVGLPFACFKGAPPLPPHAECHTSSARRQPPMATPRQHHGVEALQQAEDHLAPGRRPRSLHRPLLLRLWPVGGQRRRGQLVTPLQTPDLPATETYLTLSPLTRSSPTTRSGERNPGRTSVNHWRRACGPQGASGDAQHHQRVGAGLCVVAAARIRWVIEKQPQHTPPDGGRSGSPGPWGVPGQISHRVALRSRILATEGEHVMSATQLTPPPAAPLSAHLAQACGHWRVRPQSDQETTEITDPVGGQ